MKPSEIPQVLDLAKTINDMGLAYTPLFAGDAGIGKSKIIQQWAKDNGFKFLDIRLAYKEGPDFVGLPFCLKEDGIERTVYAIPEFWPTDEKAPTLICFEEPNRGTQSVTNCMMQILTDRAIGKYKVPGKVFFCAAINPDNQFYTVNTMDTALANRFIEYKVRYDHASFIDFVVKSNWHPNVINFLKSGAWVYAPPEQIQTNATSKYVSSRSFDYMNIAENAGLEKNRQLHYETAVGIFGEGVGTAYHKFVFEVTPVLAKDIVEDKKAAFKKLKRYTKPYRGDLLDVTVENLYSEFVNKMPGLTEELIVETIQKMPMDQGNNLLLKLFMESKIDSPKEFTKKYPELKEHIKLTLTRQANKEAEEVKKEKKK